MSILGFNKSDSFSGKNFIAAAKMVELGNLQAQLVESVIKLEIEKNKNKYHHPATIEGAEVHRDAAKFGYNPTRRGEPPRVCSCCLERVETEQIGMCYPTTDISLEAELGYEQYKLTSGVSLFFSFIKMIITYLIFRFLICDGFNLITNILYGEYCDSQAEKSCNHKIWNHMSAVNLKNNEKLLFIQDILNLALVVLSIIFFFCYRKKQYHIAKVLDETHQCEDDYTILVSNIPLIDFPTQKEAKKMRINNSAETMQLYHREHIWNFFTHKIQGWLDNQPKWNHSKGTNEGDLYNLIEKNNGSLRSSDIVKSVSLCNNLGSLEILQGERDNLVQEYEEHEKRRKQMQNEEDGSDLGIEEKESDNRFATISKQVDFLNDCEIILNKQFASDNSVLFNVTHFVGKAFVSFQYQHYREYVLEEAEKNGNFLRFNGVNLKVQKASNPRDVYWKNMRHSDEKRKKKLLKSYSVLAMVLVFALALLFGIQFLKMQNEKQNFFSSSPAFSIVATYSLVIISTLITIAVNYGLSILIRDLTKQERHLTKTNETLSLIIKTVLTQFINTTILYYLLSRILNTSFTSDIGLVIQITSLILISGLVQVFSTLFPPSMIYRSLSIFCKYRNLSAENNDTVDKFQVELNKEYQFIEFDIMNAYAYYIVMFLTSSFYAYLVPVVTPLLIIFFFLQYWIDKYNLFKRSSLTRKFNFTLTRYILKVFEFSVFVFALGSFLFSYFVKIENNVHGEIGDINNVGILPIISLIISFLYVLFLLLAPTKFERKVFGSYECSETVMYDDCVADGKFEETYWTSNPATCLVKEEDVTGRRNILNPALNKIFVKKILAEHRE